MKKLFPFLLPVIGIAAGIGVGVLLEKPAKPDQSPLAQNHASAGVHGEDKTAEHRETPAAEATYVKLNNQFVVPIIEKDVVTSIVVLSISLELNSGESEMIYAKAPKLRDGFLQVLFDHSNMGGFAGTFTNSAKMETLRRSLLSTAKRAAGDGITDVLITDLARQDV